MIFSEVMAKNDVKKRKKFQTLTSKLNKKIFFQFFCFKKQILFMIFFYIQGNKNLNLKKKLLLPYEQEKT